MATKRLTMADIAREAGVSVTTVSLCLNGKAKRLQIAEATRRRVVRVARKRLYVPSARARAMRTQRSFLIGVLMPGNIQRSFWVDIFAGIEEVIAPHGYHAILSLSHFDIEQEASALRFMLSKEVDAVLLSPVLDVSGQPGRAALPQTRGRLPLFALTRPLPGVCAIRNDNAKGGRLAATHLLEHGHRRIAYLGHPDAAFDDHGPAFMATLREAGVRVETFDDVARLVKQAAAFTAVFCCSDNWLVDLYEEAHAAGIRIPGDLSVMGYDDLEFVRNLRPRPTTVRQPKSELGRLAGETVMDVLVRRKPYPNSDQVLAPRIVDGKSVRRCAALPVGARTRSGEVEGNLT